VRRPAPAILHHRPRVLARRQRIEPGAEGRADGQRDLIGTEPAGIDLAEGAVRTAVRNAARLGLAARARFFVGDWAAAVSGRFDAVVTNPPYIATEDLRSLPPEVARYDPRQALDGGEDGLMPYRAIAAALPSLLAPEGIFAGEIGVDQADPVGAILTANGLSCDGIEKDLGGVARCLIGRPAMKS